MVDASRDRPVVLTEHARERMQERGAREEDVRAAVRAGRREPARRGLVQFRLTREFNREWNGRYYSVQQVVPVVAEEAECLVVVTVYTFYFQEGEER